MKSDRRVLITVLIAGFVVTGLFLLLAMGGGDETSASHLIGEPAPVLVADTINHGEVSLTDYQGEWVVVNFFASWCVGCVEEHPELVAFDEAYSDTGSATLLSVSFGEPVGASQTFMEELGGEWPVLLDQRGNAAVNFGVLSVPETFIVAPNGVVVDHITGPTTKAQLESIISQYLEPA